MAQPAVVRNKFTSANINSSYGKTSGPAQPRPQLNRVGSHGGMLVLGRSHGSVALPQKGPRLAIPKPVNLPSLRREHAGNDPRVSLVSGSGGGWNRPQEKPEEKIAVARAMGPESGNPKGTSTPGAVWRSAEIPPEAASTASSQPPNGRSGVYTPPAARGELGGRSLPVHRPVPVVLRGEDFPSLQATVIPLPVAVPRQREQQLKQKERAEVEKLQLQKLQEISQQQHLERQLREEQDLRKAEKAEAAPQPAEQKKGEEAQHMGALLEAQQLESKSPGELSTLSEQREPQARTRAPVQRKPDDRWSEDVTDSWRRPARPSPSPMRPPRPFSPPREPIRNWADDERAPASSLQSASSGGFSDRGEASRMRSDDRQSVRTEERRFGQGFNGRDGGFGDPGLARDSLATKRGANADDDRSRPGDSFLRGLESGGNMFGFGAREPRGLQQSWGRGPQGPEPGPGRGYGRAQGMGSRGGRQGDFLGNMLGYGLSSLPRLGIEPPPPIFNLEAKLVRKKKEELAETEYRDLERERFEAELELVQKQKESERQRKSEDERRAAEAARLEREEQERLARVEEERQLQAREAAEHALRLAEEEAKRAEEERQKVHDEKRRLAEEEEKRRENARRKLQELEERIARRAAEQKQLADESGRVGEDKRLEVDGRAGVAAAGPAQTVEERGRVWEDEERQRSDAEERRMAKPAEAAVLSSDGPLPGRLNRPQGSSLPSKSQEDRGRAPGGSDMFRTSSFGRRDDRPHRGFDMRSDMAGDDRPPWRQGPPNFLPYENGHFNPAAAPFGRDDFHAGTAQDRVFTGKGFGDREFAFSGRNGRGAPPPGGSMRKDRFRPGPSTGPPPLTMRDRRWMGPDDGPGFGGSPTDFRNGAEADYAWDEDQDQDWRRPRERGDRRRQLHAPPPPPPPAMQQPLRSPNRQGPAQPHDEFSAHASPSRSRLPARAISDTAERPKLKEDNDKVPQMHDAREQGQGRTDDAKEDEHDQAKQQEATDTEGLGDSSADGQLAGSSADADWKMGALKEETKVDISSSEDVSRQVHLVEETGAEVVTEQVSSADDAWDGPASSAEIGASFQATPVVQTPTFGAFDSGARHDPAAAAAEEGQGSINGSLQTAGEAFQGVDEELASRSEPAEYEKNASQAVSLPSANRLAQTSPPSDLLQAQQSQPVQIPPALNPGESQQSPAESSVSLPYTMFPAIQIGSIQMPLQFGQLGTTFEQVAPSQVSVLQFGQLGQPALLPSSLGTGVQQRQAQDLGPAESNSRELQQAEKGEKPLELPQTTTACVAQKAESVANAAAEGVPASKEPGSGVWQASKSAWSSPLQLPGSVQQAETNVSGSGQARDAGGMTARASRLPARRAKERPPAREVVNANAGPPPSLRAKLPSKEGGSVAAGLVEPEASLASESVSATGEIAEAGKAAGESVDGTGQAMHRSTGEAGRNSWRQPVSTLPSGAAGRGRGAGLLGAGRGRGRGLGSISRGGGPGGLEGTASAGAGMRGFTSEMSSDGVVVRTRPPARRQGLRRPDLRGRDSAEGPDGYGTGGSLSSSINSLAAVVPSSQPPLLPTPVPSGPAPPAVQKTEELVAQPIPKWEHRQQQHQQQEVLLDVAEAAEISSSAVREGFEVSNTAVVGWPGGKETGEAGDEGMEEPNSGESVDFLVFGELSSEVIEGSDDFIQVRSKRQLLNDRREQREKELKAKVRDQKTPKDQGVRKPKGALRAGTAPSQGAPPASGPSKAAVGPTRLAVSDASGTGPPLPAAAPVFAGQGGPAAPMANETAAPLAPIGPPALATLSRTSGAALPGMEGPSVVPAAQDAAGEPTIAWGGGGRSARPVVSLTQIQMEESIGPHMRLQGPGPLAPSSASAAAAASLPGPQAGPIHSLLAGGHIQFGTAVTAPLALSLPPGMPSGSSLLPGQGQGSTMGKGTAGVGQEDELSPFGSKKRARGESGQRRRVVLDPDPDAEAEAAASAVAAAAISSDESVGSTRNEERDVAADMDLDRVGRLLPTEAEVFPEAAAAATSANGPPHDVSMASVLPADLSLVPAPAPGRSQSPVVQAPQPIQRPGMTSGPFEMGPMLGGPGFPFAAADMQGRFAGGPASSSTEQSVGLAGMGPWGPGPGLQMPSSGMDSFYTAQGFAGPYMSPGAGGMPSVPGLQGIQGPPMLLYAKSPFGGQFGQLGMGYLPAYIPTGKQPDWKHTPLQSGGGTSGAVAEVLQLSHGPAPQKAPGPSSGPPLSMAGPGHGPFDNSFSAPFQLSRGESSMAGPWPRMTGLPGQQRPGGGPLLGFAMPGLPSHGHGPTSRPAPLPHPAAHLPQNLDVHMGGAPKEAPHSFSTSDAAAQFPDELGLGDTPSGPPAVTSLGRPHGGQGIGSSTGMSSAQGQAGLAGSHSGSSGGGGGGGASKQGRGPRRPPRLSQRGGMANGLPGHHGGAVGAARGPAGGLGGHQSGRPQQQQQQQQQEMMGSGMQGAEHRAAGASGGQQRGGWNGGQRGRGGGASRQAHMERGGAGAPKVRHEYVPKASAGATWRAATGAGRADGPAPQTGGKSESTVIAAAGH